MKQSGCRDLGFWVLISCFMLNIYPLVSCFTFHFLPLSVSCVQLCSSPWTDDSVCLSVLFLRLLRFSSLLWFCLPVMFYLSFLPPSSRYTRLYFDLFLRCSQLPLEYLLPWRMLFGFWTWHQESKQLGQTGWIWIHFNSTQSGFLVSCSTVNICILWSGRI